MLITKLWAKCRLLPVVFSAEWEHVCSQWYCTARRVRGGFVQNHFIGHTLAPRSGCMARSTWKRITALGSSWELLESFCLSAVSRFCFSRVCLKASLPSYLSYRMKYLHPQGLSCAFKPERFACADGHGASIHTAFFSSSTIVPLRFARLLPQEIGMRRLSSSQHRSESRANSSQKDDAGKRNLMRLP